MVERKDCCVCKCVRERKKEKEMGAILMVLLQRRDLIGFKVGCPEGYAVGCLEGCLLGRLEG